MSPFPALLCAGLAHGYVTQTKLVVQAVTAQIYKSFFHHCWHKRERERKRERARERESKREREGEREQERERERDRARARERERERESKREQEREIALVKWTHVLWIWTSSQMKCLQLGQWVTSEHPSRGISRNCWKYSTSPPAWRHENRKPSSAFAFPIWWHICKATLELLEFHLNQYCVYLLLWLRRFAFNWLHCWPFSAQHFVFFSHLENGI